jgi:hypothetical protein
MTDTKLDDVEDIGPEDVGSTEDASSDVQRATERLNEFADAGSGENLVDLFRHYLDGDIDEGTYSELVEAVALLLADSTAFFMILTAAQEKTDEALDNLKLLNFRPAAFQLVVRIIALYRGPLSIAYYRWRGTRDREDWTAIRRSIAHHVENDEYEISLLIEKNTGETMKLRTNPASLMRLAAAVLEIMPRVGDKGAFSDEGSTRLIETMDEVRAWISKDASTSRSSG